MNFKLIKVKTQHMKWSFILYILVLSFGALFAQSAPSSSAERDANPLHFQDSSFIKGVPIIEFEKQFHDFGAIHKGDKPVINFVFENKGSAPLIIDMASACECTTLEWSDDIILPGEKGFVHAKYDSSEKEGEQEVTIDVIAYKILPGQEDLKEDDILLSQTRFRAFVDTTANK